MRLRDVLYTAFNTQPLNDLIFAINAIHANGIFSLGELVASI